VIAMMVHSEEVQLRIKRVKDTLECDAHNIGEAFKLGQHKRVITYINKTKKDMVNQHRQLTRLIKLGY